jgi:hypothetical protein
MLAAFAVYTFIFILLQLWRTGWSGPNVTIPALLLKTPLFDPDRLYSDRNINILIYLSVCWQKFVRRRKYNNSRNVMYIRYTWYNVSYLLISWCKDCTTGNQTCSDTTYWVQLSKFFLCLDVPLGFTVESVSIFFHQSFYSTVFLILPVFMYFIFY